MRRTTKYVCSVLLLIAIAYEMFFLAWAFIAAHRAKRLSQLVSTLKPGATSQVALMRVLEAHGWNVVRVGCPSSGSCGQLYASVANRPLFARPILLPVQPSGYGVTFFFVGDSLNGINEKLEVGISSVQSSRYAENDGKTVFRSSEWRYEEGGMAVAIRALSSGDIIDVPASKFEFGYMHSLGCVDAHILWPLAPPPTLELHGWPGCKTRAKS
jgi:hypothetical protein